MQTAEKEIPAAVHWTLLTYATLQPAVPGVCRQMTERRLNENNNHPAD